MIDNCAPETYFHDPGHNMMPDMPYPPDMHRAPQQLPGMYCPPAGPCIPQETVLYNVKLARAYVPFQKYCTTYEPVEGLDKGTVFPELYSPYTAPDKRCKPPVFD